MQFWTLNSCLVVFALQFNSDGRDWRKELLDAVEKVLEQERSLLTTALDSSPSAEGVEPARETAGINLQTLRDQVNKIEPICVIYVQ